MEEVDFESEGVTDGKSGDNGKGKPAQLKQKNVKETDQNEASQPQNETES